MSSFSYKCINCGGALKFNADTQNWKCEYCNSSFNKEEIKAIENNNNHDSIHRKQSYTNEFEEKACAYVCSSCGAEIVTDDTTAATFCYYCHNPAILTGQLSGDYKPSKVIPFKFKRDAATATFIKWCKRKPLLSKDFISSSQLEKLTGVYIPFWLFDCDIRGRISADAKNIRTWVSGDMKYTETKYYNVFREILVTYNGIPADGLKKADDKLMELLEPYDYSQLEDFSMSYLSGYFAEKYDVDEKGVYDRISQRIKRYTDTLLRNTINGYDSISINDSHADVYSSKGTYVLLPTWMFTYNYKGKTYVFAMNGQTGKVAGSLPISKARLLAWFSAISGIAFVILLIGGILL